MNIVINVNAPIKRVQEFQEYNLGQITTTLQDLLDNSSIIIDSNIIPILKVLSIDNIPKSYLIKDLSESLYNTGDYITGQDLIEENLILIGGDNQSSEIEINTAFVNKSYSSTMNVVHDNTNPNFEIDLTGNLDLTITGTVNGDSGMVNLYFPSTEVATLNGFGSLVITGAGEMIPVYFIHDSDGLKWYNGVGSSIVPVEEIFTLYQKKPTRINGTITNVGNVVTGIGTTFENPYSLVGAKIVKANGETAIIATIVNNTSLTTVLPFATDSVNSSYQLRAKAIEIIDDGDGKILMYDRVNQRKIFESTDDGHVIINGARFDKNGYIYTLEVLKTRQYIPDFIYNISNINPSPGDVGTTVTVNDALTPTYGGIYVGGGTEVCKVIWDGTNYRTR